MTPLIVMRLDRHNSTGMEAHPARTFEEEARKRERVRCSSLVDWLVYPRLRRLYLVGFHSRASRCASAIWSGVILAPSAAAAE